MKKSKNFTIQTRVIYADVDQMSIVYHSNYLRFFEIARGELLREVGYPYVSLERQGIYLPVFEAQLKYLKPARYDDLLTVNTHLTQEERHPLRFCCHYEIYCSSNLLVTGYTWHLLLGADGRPLRPRGEIRELLDKMFEVIYNR